VLSSRMKAIFLLIGFSFLSAAGICQAHQFKTNGKEEAPVESRVINDTLEAKIINGEERLYIYKNSSGKTLRIQEKDSLMVKFKDANVGILMRRGNPSIVTLSFPGEAGYGTLQEKVNKENKQTVSDFKEKWIHKPITPLVLDGIDNTKYDFDKLKGHVLVLNFWFIGCAPCVREIPELNKLVTAFKNENVLFLAFGLEDGEKIKDFLKKREFNYQHIPSTKEISMDLGVRAWPTHMVIDREGIVKMVQVGGDNILENLTPAIEQSLK
jgi:thiol-disulfide isomerase/thioredoxin